MLHRIRYLLEIYLKLPGNWKEKRRVLSRIRSSILDYVSESSYVSYDRLVQRFGTPDQIVSGFIGEMEPMELLTLVHTKKEVLRNISLTALLLVLMWAGLIAASYLTYQDDMTGYLVIGEVEIDEKNIVLDEVS